MRTLVAALGLFCSCSLVPAQAESQPSGTTARHNVLILVLDDVGVDYVSCYKEGSDPASTPNIDALARRGVLFRNAWATPLCSSTRACILTGRYGFRTGVGTVMTGGGLRQGRRGGRGGARGAGRGSQRGRRGGGRGGGRGGRRGGGRGGGATSLAKAEFTLPELLDAGGSGHTHAAFGKWHLGGGARGPNDVGFSHYAGGIAGMLRGRGGFYRWQRTVDGVTAESDSYATTQQVDDALAWIRKAQKEQKPWVCYLSFHAPHSPFHVPPRQLTGDKQPDAENTIACYRAMIQAADTEIGRLLRELGPATKNTNIIFLGDNGTPRQVVQQPFDRTRAKGSLYEGGINVPFLVAGPVVVSPGRESPALVSATDIYATVGELCGIDVASTVPKDHTVDSVSFVPTLKEAGKSARKFVYSELFQGNRPDQNSTIAIRDRRYKLIRRILRWGKPRDQFFDLEKDPFEQQNLIRSEMSPEQKRHYEALGAEITRLRASASRRAGDKRR